jgi:hypothetical protein
MELKNLFSEPNILKRFEKTKKGANSERASILSEMLEEINKERIADGKPQKYKDKSGKWKELKPMTGKEIGLRTAHVKTNDLYPFHSNCMDYKHRQGSYSRYFFGKLKI